MKIVQSHPTARGGGIAYPVPVTGMAYVVVGSHTYRVRLINSSIQALEFAAIGDTPLADGTVWFEDDRERSH